jgi:hypothetical protein
VRFDNYLIEASKPDLKDGEYAVPHIKKEKVRDINPRTNRMKNFKRTNWIVTEVAPEDRTFDNLPRYKDGGAQVKFTDWLSIKGNPGKGTDGKWYGWSHRAIYGFKPGDTVKPGDIGNKYQYTPEVSKKYMDIMTNDGMDAADKYMKTITFEPYQIEDDEDAQAHALRFHNDVS